MRGTFWAVRANGEYWADRPALFSDQAAAEREAKRRAKDAQDDGIDMTFDVLPLMVRTVVEWQQREQLIRDLCFKIDVLEDELGRIKG